MLKPEAAAGRASIQLSSLPSRVILRTTSCGFGESCSIAPAASRIATNGWLDPSQPGISGSLTHTSQLSICKPARAAITCSIISTLPPRAVRVVRRGVSMRFATQALIRAAWPYPRGRRRFRYWARQDETRHERPGRSRNQIPRWRPMWRWCVVFVASASMKTCSKGHSSKPDPSGRRADRSARRVCLNP